MAGTFTSSTYLIKGDVLGRKQRGLEGLLARRMGEGGHEPRAEQQVGLPDYGDIQVGVRRQHLRNQQGQEQRIRN